MTFWHSVESPTELRADDQIRALPPHNSTATKMAFIRVTVKDDAPFDSRE